MTVYCHPDTTVYCHPAYLTYVQSTSCEMLDWMNYKLESVLKENQPWICIGRMMLKLKLQYFGHLMQRADSLEKTLMTGKSKGKRIQGQQRRRYLDSILTQWAWIWANCRIEWQTGKPGMLQSMGSQKVRHDFARKQQQCIFSFNHQPPSEISALILLLVQNLET